MRFLSFTITNYRAIRGPLKVNLARNALMPIIGINESGKSTILQAIFAFDSVNDRENDGRHLEDTSNLYEIESKNPIVSCEIGFEGNELRDVADEFRPNESFEDEWTELRAVIESVHSPLVIYRNLNDRCYSINLDHDIDQELVHSFAESVINHMPYILYFDDFRDSIEDEIEIVKDDRGQASGWLETIDILFKRATEGISVFDIAKMEERRRRSVIQRVQKHLNDRLTKAWRTFRLDDAVSDLEIEITFS
jgi:predicted ATP-dependent endonuclease of OLD family